MTPILKRGSIGRVKHRIKATTTQTQLAYNQRKELLERANDTIKIISDIINREDVSYTIKRVAQTLKLAAIDTVKQLKKLIKQYVFLVTNASFMNLPEFDLHGLDPGTVVEQFARPLIEQTLDLFASEVQITLICGKGTHSEGDEEAPVKNTIIQWLTSLNVPFNLPYKPFLVDDDGNITIQFIGKASAAK